MLTVSPSPHDHAPDTVRRIMLDVAVALVPACVAALYFFGVRAALLLVVCVGTALAVEALAEEPGIAAVIDLHRDALGSGDVTYKIMAEETGVVASQLMLLVGSDAGGLSHPGWRDNLAFALYLQRAANAAYPTLMRPVDLVPQRYNQQLSPGMLILEVGSSGNTLQEALAAVRLFGEATAPALLALTEDAAED